MRYKNKKMVEKKNKHSQNHTDWCHGHDRNSGSIFKGEPIKKQFGSNSLSLLHPLEGTTFKVSLIPVLALDLHNTFLQMSQLNSAELTLAVTFLIWISTLWDTLHPEHNIL